MIKPTRVLEYLYEKIWAYGYACKECRFYQLETDDHPYGERTVEESGYVCNTESEYMRCPELQDVVGQMREAIYNANKPKEVR